MSVVFPIDRTEDRWNLIHNTNMLVRTVGLSLCQVNKFYNLGKHGIRVIDFIVDKCNIVTWFKNLE